MVRFRQICRDIIGQNYPNLSSSNIVSTSSSDFAKTLSKRKKTRSKKDSSREMQNEESTLDENFKIENEDTLLGVKTEESIDVMFYTPLDDFEHEEIIGETKWTNASDFIDVDKVIDLPNSTNAFIVNPKGANVTMQEAYYLPVSPHDNQCWGIQREDKFLIEADQTNSFDIYTGDYSAPNVLRVSVIQKTPQQRGSKDADQSISQDAIIVNDAENLTESIWNDYNISQLPTLENNLENVMTGDLMSADIVNEQLLSQGAGAGVSNVNGENETVAVLGPISVENDDSLMVTCRCCNKNFTFYDLKLHIAEKSSEGCYKCDRCNELFLLKEDLNNHMLTHLAEDKFFDCTRCNAKFAEESSLTEHLKVHVSHATLNLSSSFKCSFCLDDFPDENQLETHVQVAHAAKRVKIEPNETATSVENRNGVNESPDKNTTTTITTTTTSTTTTEDTSEPTETTKHEKIVVQCPKCHKNYYFVREAEVDAYIKTHVPTTYYKCGFCDTTVMDKDEFNEHMKSHTTIVEGNNSNKFRYKCRYCENVAFETIEELTSHTQMHVPRQVSVCPKCNAQFVRETRKTDVAATVSPPAHSPIKIKSNFRKETTNKLKTTPILTPADKVPPRENFKCKTCAAVFKKQDEFNKHAKTHIIPDTKPEVSDVKVDPSYCAYCSSELLSIAEIIVHIRKHTEERKQFPCSNCDKKTTHERTSNSNNRGKENLCNYCLSKMNENFTEHG